MDKDLTYYGCYAAADLLEGACQAFMKGCFSAERGDAEMLQEANEDGARFSAALRLMAERESQKFLH